MGSKYDNLFDKHDKQDEVGLKYVEDGVPLLNHCIDKMTKTIKCVHCNRDLRVPLVTSKSDRDQMSMVADFFDEFFQEHPEMEDALMKDFVDGLMDTLARIQHMNRENDITDSGDSHG